MKMPKLPPVVSKILIIIGLVLGLTFFAIMLHMANDRKDCTATDSSKTWQGRMTTSTGILGVTIFTVMLAWKLYMLLPSKLLQSKWSILIFSTIISIFMVFLFSVVIEHTKKCGGAPNDKSEPAERILWGMDIAALSISCIVLALCIVDYVSIAWDGPFISTFIAGSIETVSGAKAELGKGAGGEKGTTLTSMINPLFEAEGA